MLDEAAAELAQALPAVALDERALDRLTALLRLVAATEHAPTKIRSPHEAARRHVADSLVALEVEGLGDARTIADLGSGAGFPGLALAAALPGAAVRLVESQRRKCEFLRSAVEVADLRNVTVVCIRAEEWREGVRANEVVAARALAPQPVVLEYAAPLLTLGGLLIDWRGTRQPAEEAAADVACELLGLERVEVLPARPFEGVRDRNLHVFAKVAETPARFPRRAGVASKRPLAR